MRQRIPLVGSLTNRVLDGIPKENWDQIFQNCFPIVTKNAITGAGSATVVKRQGFTVAATLASAGFTGNEGACVWTGYSATGLTVVSVSNVSTQVVRIYDINGVQIGGDIINSYNCRSITETKISGVAHLVAYIVDNGTPSVVRAYFFPLGGAWTQITDADFPPNFATPISVVGDPVHLNGVMVAMALDGKLYNSDLNSLSGWTSTSFLEAQRKPDAGRGLQNTRDAIAAIGVDSIEFFSYTGNASGSVLTKIPGAIVNIGVLYDAPTRKSIVVEDKLFVIGTSAETNTTHIYLIDGYQARRISNDAVDEYLNALTVLFYAHFVGVIRSHGTTHLLTNITSTGGASYMAYCLTTGVWWRFAFVGDNATSPKAAIGDYLVDGISRTLHQHGSGYQDNGNTIVMTIQTKPLDHGTNRKKFFTAAEVICDSQTTSGNISISWSDDDYATFSTARTIDPSTGQKRLMRLGSTLGRYNNKRAWKITETVNRPFRGEAIDIEYEVGET